MHALTRLQLNFPNGFLVESASFFYNGYRLPDLACRFEEAQTDNRIR